MVEQARQDSLHEEINNQSQFLAETRILKKNQWAYGLETYGASFWLDNLDKGKDNCFNSQVSRQCPSNFNEIYTYGGKKVIFLTAYGENSFT